MRHPKDRQERRGVRERYIQRRRKVRLHHWYRYFEYDLDNPPPIHETWEYECYQEYVAWNNLTEDEKKIKRVEAFLDGEDPKSIEPRWLPREKGRLAKWNLTCSCYSCTEHKSQGTRKRFRLRMKKFEDSPSQRGRMRYFIPWWVLD